MPSKFGGIPVEGQAPAQSRFGGVPIDQPVAAPTQPAKVYTEADISPMARQSRAELGDVGEGLNALREAMQDFALAGGSDELGSVIVGTGQAMMDWFRGGSFDPVKHYGERIEKAEDYKAARQQRFPVTSAVGSILGSLTGAGTLAKAGLTTAGRTVPYVPSILQPVAQVGTAALEGAAVGGLQGTLSAPPGERIAGGKRGAVTGALTSGLFQTAGSTASAIDDVFARRAAVKARPPVSEILKAEKNAFYKASEDAGMMVKQPAIARLRANLEIVAGKINPYNRPYTAGQVDDAKARLTSDMTLKELDEFRQSLGDDINAAKGNDKTKLIDMKGVIDGFLDNSREGDFTGGPEALPLIKRGRELNRQQKQMEIFEDIRDKATRAESGYDAGLVTGFRALANNKKLMSQYSKEQQDFIKKITTLKSPTTWLRGIGKALPPKLGWPVMAVEIFTQGLPVTSTAAILASATARKLGAKYTQSKIAAAERAIVKTPKASHVAPVPTIIPTAPVALEAERQRRVGGLGGPR